MWLAAKFQWFLNLLHKRLLGQEIYLMSRYVDETPIYVLSSFCTCIISNVKCNLFFDIQLWRNHFAFLGP